ncbi:hypothetical protein HWV62_18158 [Athelia sp. TMB]|nr:hypothetical protein HWV62_18158 [Athelia sp. TMB]
MISPKAQQSPYIIKRRGANSESGNDSDALSLKTPTRLTTKQQQRPLSPPHSSDNSTGDAKRRKLIAHSKLQTLTLPTSSLHVVKRAHAQRAGPSEHTTPAPSYDRARAHRPVSPSATENSFHTARDGESERESDRGDRELGSPNGDLQDSRIGLGIKPHPAWAPYEYPSPPMTPSTSSNSPIVAWDSHSASASSMCAQASNTTHRSRLSDGGLTRSPSVVSCAHSHSSTDSTYSTDSVAASTRYQFEASAARPQPYPSPLQELQEPTYELGGPNTAKNLPPLPPPSPAQYPPPTFVMQTRSAHGSTESVDTIRNADPPVEGERRVKAKKSVKAAMSLLFTASGRDKLATKKSSATLGPTSVRDTAEAEGSLHASRKLSTRSLPFGFRRRRAPSSFSAPPMAELGMARPDPMYDPNSPAAHRARRQNTLAVAQVVKDKPTGALKTALRQRLPIELPATALFSDGELLNETGRPTVEEMREAAQMEVLDQDGRRIRFGSLFERDEGRTVVCFIRHFW